MRTSKFSANTELSSTPMYLQPTNLQQDGYNCGIYLLAANQRILDGRELAGSSKSSNLGHIDCDKTRIEVLGNLCEGMHAENESLRDGQVQNKKRHSDRGGSGSTEWEGKRSKSRRIGAEIGDGNGLMNDIMMTTSCDDDNVHDANWR